MSSGKKAVRNQDMMKVGRNALIILGLFFIFYIFSVMMTTVCWGCDDWCGLFFLFLPGVVFLAGLLQEHINKIAPEADGERTHIKVRTEKAQRCEKDGNYDEAIHIWDELGRLSEVARAKKKQKEWEEAKLRKERKEKIREAHNLEERFQKERKNEDVEPDKYLDHALEIWKELGEGSEIERINELKVKYLYEKLKKKIEKLKNKGVDYTQLEEELATLEKILDKPYFQSMIKILVGFSILILSLFLEKFF